MTKIYTSDSETSQEVVKSPSEQVINNLLNYSKSLEVLKSEKKKTKKVELILN